MDRHTNFILNLFSVSNLLGKQSNLEEGLRKVASMTAQMLKTQSCSIVLLSEPENQANGNDKGDLRVFTHYGNLPESAAREAMRLNDGIADYVAATGKPLLIQDITQSEFLGADRFLAGGNESFMSVPILLSEQVIGVVNVSRPTEKSSFDQEDLEILKLLALIVGKSIHIAQLQTILKSRFVELAVASELKEGEVKESLALNPNPTKLAKIVAKSFFSELTKAGFGPSQIIEIATEVLNLLQNSLDKHKRRLARDEPELTYSGE